MKIGGNDGLTYFAAPIQTVAWSTDSSRIAVVLGASGHVPHIVILSPDMRDLGQVDADYLAWTGPDTYVAFRQLAVFTGRVGSSATTIPGAYTQLVAGHRGAVALINQETGSDHYRLVTSAGLSGLREGVPIAFSWDDSMLAVVHWPRACCAGEPSPAPSKAPGPPTLDVIRVSDGSPLATNANVLWAYGAYVAFSLDGRYVAFDMYGQGSGAQLDDVAVMEIATKKVWILSPPANADYSLHVHTWTSNDTVVVGGTASPLPVGLPVSVQTLADDRSQLFVAANGRTATTSLDASAKVVVTTGGQSRTIDLAAEANWAAWSPDGRQLAIVCGGQPGTYTSDALVIIRP